MGNYLLDFQEQHKGNLADTTAPYITSGPSVSSNNSYSSLLTSSDTLTLTFTTNKTINTTIVINNQTISSSNISNGDNTWTATYSPQATHPIGPIDYYITYEFCWKFILNPLQELVVLV